MKPHKTGKTNISILIKRHKTMCKFSRNSLFVRQTSIQTLHLKWKWVRTKLMRTYLALERRSGDGAWRVSKTLCFALKMTRRPHFGRNTNSLYHKSDSTWRHMSLHVWRVCQLIIEFNVPLVIGFDVPVVTQDYFRTNTHCHSSRYIQNSSH